MKGTFLNWDEYTRTILHQDEIPGIYQNSGIIDWLVASIILSTGRMRMGNDQVFYNSGSSEILFPHSSDEVGVSSIGQYARSAGEGTARPR